MPLESSFLLISCISLHRCCCSRQHRKRPESPRPLLLINWIHRCRRCCACQHREHPESPRPLAVAVPKIEDFRAPRNLRFLAKQDICALRTARADSACLSDSPPARAAVALSVRQDRNRDGNGARNATAQLPQASALPSLGRGAPAPPRKTVRAACGSGLPGCDFRPLVRSAHEDTTAARPALPRTRCSRAPTATHRTTASRRATTAEEPPVATPGNHSGVGLKGAAAERDALRS